MSKQPPEQRSVLVTGASSGIGHAVARELARAGHRVTGVSRRTGQFELDEQISEHSIDLADIEALPDKLKLLVKSNPDTDVLICNAGIGRFGSMEEFSYRQISELVNLNLVSQIYLVRAFLPAMKRRGYGNLIFIGSEAALDGGGRGAVYSATKFGLRGLAQALRKECAKSGFKVTQINPGMVKTPFFDNLSFQPGEDGENYLLPEDIAIVVASLLRARPEVVVDELNLSPLRKHIHFDKSS